MSDVALITGSSGLIGSEAVRFFLERGFKVVGIDNDMRGYFFGPDGSTRACRQQLETLPDYSHADIDIRDLPALKDLYSQYGGRIKVIIHTAAQPSHDWAAKEPFTDFHINAAGTLNLLEMTRQYCPDAPFIFTSTNKVYGDTPNRLPLVEDGTRWDLLPEHPLFNGIDESMSIDQSKHSLFGASKAAADVLVQEYGRYFDMPTACFRGGCLTGPQHAGAELHGFLAYLVKCCVEDRTYRIFGYKGKQVRDNIHSQDLVRAFWEFYQAPRKGEVYNIGGGRVNSCSILEAVTLAGEICGKKLKTEYVEQNRSGDHMWYISSLDKFKDHYPDWDITVDLKRTINQIYESLFKT